MQIELWLLWLMRAGIFEYRTPRKKTEKDNIFCEIYEESLIHDCYSLLFLI